MSTVKKRRRSSLASFKIKLTESPKDETGTPESESSGDKQMKRLIPHPDNIAMDETIEMLAGRISRLQAEEKAWNDYVKKLDDKAAEVERLLENKVITIKDVTMTDDMVSAYMYPMNDLEELTRRVNIAVKKSRILAVEHERTVDRLDRQSAAIQTQYEHVLKSLQVDTAQTLTCPKQTIETYCTLPYNT